MSEVLAEGAASAAPEPSTLALQIAGEQAAFGVLEKEWNDLDRKVAAKATELRQCGERLVELVRKRDGSDVAGYNPDGGAR